MASVERARLPDCDDTNGSSNQTHEKDRAPQKLVWQRKNGVHRVPHGIPVSA